MPPTPPTFSTITDWPRISPRRGTNTRLRPSLPPPAPPPPRRKRNHQCERPRRPVEGARGQNRKRNGGEPDGSQLALHCHAILPPSCGDQKDIISWQAG